VDLMARKDAKSAWLGRARAVAKKIERYATHGYVTEIEAYQKDDAALLRAIDRLYDTQRSAGLAEDRELTGIRESLRASWLEARNKRAPASRASYYDGKANAARREMEARLAPGERAFLGELAVGRARRAAGKEFGPKGKL
jgi:hypothetical protein